MLKPVRKPQALKAVPDISPPPPLAAPSRKTLILRWVGASLALLALVWALHWLIIGRFQIATDDAFIQSDMSALAARVSGTVLNVSVAENASVKAGDVLLTLDAGDHEIAVTAANARIETQTAAIARIGQQLKSQGAAIAAARANALAAKAEVDRAEGVFARAQTLKSKQFASLQTLDTARAARDSAAASFAAAQANVATAEGQLEVLKAQGVEAAATVKELETAREKALRDLGFTQIRAPFDGRIGNRAVEPGQYVQPGTRLLALVPADGFYIEANYKETQLSRIKPGQPAEIEVDAFAGNLEGVVESIAPASGAQFALLPPENATGNFTKIVQRVPVRIRITDAHGETLRPGLSTTVTIDTRD